MSPQPQRIELGFPHRAYIRIAISAAPLGLAAFVLVHIWHIVSPEPDYDWGRYPSNHVVGLAVSAVVAMVIACALFAIRERGAYVTWDAHGITEWIGRAPRVAIVWADARVSRARFRVRSKGGTYGDGEIEQWDDGRGRLITIASTTRGIPGWLLRKRCLGATGAITPPPGVRPAAGEGIVPDTTYTRTLSWWTWPLRLGYLPLFFMLETLLDRRQRLDGSTLFALALVTLPLCLRLVRPLMELWRVTRASTRMAGARRVEILGNAGPDGVSTGAVVQAREADGTMVEIDTAPLSHDDALLALRRGPVWVLGPRPEARGGGPDAMPYRQGVAAPVRIRVDRLEHDGMRAARASLIGAITLELLARFGVAVIPTLYFAAMDVFLARPDPYGY